MARLERAIPLGITPFPPIHGTLRSTYIVMARRRPGHPTRNLVNLTS